MLNYVSFTEQRCKQRAEFVTQEWFDRMHDRASDNLAGLDGWKNNEQEQFDLSDQILIGGYCLDRVTE